MKIKRKHLTHDDRMVIQTMLNEGESIKSIAKAVNKHPTTIKNEIYERSEEVLLGAVGRPLNRCVKRKTCIKIQLCENKLNCTRKCSTCRECNKNCPEFIEELCQKLNKPPYVCNGCKERPHCQLRKILYFSRKAEESYRETLVKTREGINITEEALNRLDNIVSPRILKGQSVHHILSSMVDKLPASEKTVYRWISAGLLAARNGDLPRRCMIKPRKTKKVEHKVDRKCRIGRSLEAYQKLFEDIDTQPPRILMDTVVSSKCKQTFLTIHFAESHFMITRLLPDKTSDSVIKAFNTLEEDLGYELFAKLFPAILTDNGSEFSNPEALEFGALQQRRTRIFYCEPYHSNQKAEIERNHEFLRLFYPKGSTFSDLTQEKVDLMLSHINSYKRRALGDATPYDLFALTYGQDVLDKLNQTRIPEEQIILKKKLLED